MRRSASADACSAARYASRARDNACSAASRAAVAVFMAMLFRLLASLCASRADSNRTRASPHRCFSSSSRPSSDAAHSSFRKRCSLFSIRFSMSESVSRVDWASFLEIFVMRSCSRAWSLFFSSSRYASYRRSVRCTAASDTVSRLSAAATSRRASATADAMSPYAVIASVSERCSSVSAVIRACIRISSWTDSC